MKNKPIAYYISVSLSYSLFFSIKCDYLKLNQFSYNSYSSSLETTKFLAHCVKDYREKQFWSPTSPRKAHGNVLIRIDLCAETWEKKGKGK